ncbi:MAG: glycosyltransferase family 2 protein [Deltaproteobacteria bacterium]|nr:glycosyltransferase family 2 protein [Deltaproteobacteria bacterium]
MSGPAASAPLSVVIPAYNEETRLPATLTRIAAHLKTLEVEAEIVVVDDGSTDRTAAVVQGLAGAIPGLRLDRHPENRGKGAAVRSGVLQAAGGYILISDADLSTPIEELDRFLPLLQAGADLVIGSRAHPASRILLHQPWHREMMGKLFNLFVRVLVLRGLKDTQCGFKALRAPTVRPLFARQRITGFGFDVEILYLARKAGLAIQEVPVTWINSPSSRVHLLKHPLGMLLDLFRIRLNDLRGCYRGLGADTR